MKPYRTALPLPAFPLASLSVGCRPVAAGALLVASSLAACGESGGDASSLATADPVAVPTAGRPVEPAVGQLGGGAGTSLVTADVLDDGDDPDAAVRQLETRLTTRFVDAANHDAWFCLGETSVREYRLTVAEDGTRGGRELDGHGLDTDITFGWAAIGADTLLLDYPEKGEQTEIAAIRFADDDTFRASDGASGAIECRRQRYVDGMPTRGATPMAPEDVDRDVEAAAALAARVRTRRLDGGDYWYCESDDASPRAFVFAAAGVLDAEPRALLFDDPVVDGAGTEASPSIEIGSADARAFRWLATDGTTLVLVPLEADVAMGDDADGTVATTMLGEIVFPVDGAFTATDESGRTLQCLRVTLDE